jgi:hypothetical protein
MSIDDIMDKTSYGQAALRKFGAVPDGFHIFEAGWIGARPEDWKSMRVTGAQFVGRRRVPHTTMSTIVTVDEMAEFKGMPDTSPKTSTTGTPT